MRAIKAFQNEPSFAEVIDLLEVLDFGFKLQVAITDSLADGKVNIFDIPNFFKVVGSANAAFQGIANVREEFTNLSKEGKIIVNDFVQDRFDLQNDALEALIKETIDTVVSIVAVSFKWIDYKRPALVA
jgi:hypothetical protein